MRKQSYCIDDRCMGHVVGSNMVFSCDHCGGPSSRDGFPVRFPIRRNWPNGCPKVQLPTQTK